MNKRNQDGAVNILLVPLIVAGVLLLAALAFGAWAFSSRQDYKNNSDQKAAVAVTAAKKQEDAVKDRQYAEAAKYPLQTYRGSEQFGSVVLQYPKTWNAYDNSGGDQVAVDVYFAPGVVPTISDPDSTYALRLQVINQTYDQVVNSFSQQSQLGITSSPYTLPKLPKVYGEKLTGQIEKDKTGTMIIMPIRNTTLEVWTESAAFEADFENNILPNLSFSP